MPATSNARTNSEHSLKWNCWKDSIPQEHRKAIAHWAACYPSALPGDALRLLRECIGISKGDLAGYLGVAERRVARWENGKPGTDPLAERSLRVLYLNNNGDRSTLADVKALLEVTQNWPTWVKLEQRPYGWRAVAYGELQPDVKKAPRTRAPRKVKKVLGLRLVSKVA